MRRFILSIGLLVACPARSWAGEMDLRWLDRSLAYYLVSPHQKASLYDISMAPQVSKSFRQDIFRINPRRYGPHAPVKRFLMEDFEAEVRRHFAGEPRAKTEIFMSELRRLMAIEGLPVRMTAAEFQLLLEKPGSKRFASVDELPDPIRSRGPFVDELKRSFEVFSVREAVRALRSDSSLGLSKTWGHEKSELLRQSIDNLLAEDNDWEFCDRNLSDVGRVPEAYLERFGFVLK